VVMVVVGMMPVCVLVTEGMLLMGRFIVYIKLESLNSALGLAVYVQVVAVDRKPFQFTLQSPEIHAKIQHGADEHVTADSGKNIKVEGLHIYVGVRS